MAAADTDFEGRGGAGQRRPGRSKFVTQPLMMVKVSRSSNGKVCSTGI